MNNDLISREALKRKLQYVYSCDYIDSKSKEGIASDIIDEIDNAPTVDVEDFKKFVESRLDMQDLYLPIHFFYLLDEYLEEKNEADNDN